MHSTVLDLRNIGSHCFRTHLTITINLVVYFIKTIKGTMMVGNNVIVKMHILPFLKIRRLCVAKANARNGYNNKQKFDLNSFIFLRHYVIARKIRFRNKVKNINKYYFFDLYICQYEVISKNILLNPSCQLNKAPVIIF